MVIFQKYVFSRSEFLCCEKTLMRLNKLKDMFPMISICLIHMLMSIQCQVSERLTPKRGLRKMEREKILRDTRKIGLYLYYIYFRYDNNIIISIYIALHHALLKADRSETPVSEYICVIYRLGENLFLFLN